MISSIQLLERERSKRLNQLCRVANKIKAIDIEIADLRMHDKERQIEN